MTRDLPLRRKWTFRAHERQMVFVKKPLESASHVMTKALIWALYLPDYPKLSVEIDIGNRYKPDLVQLDDRGQPVFWAEAGHAGLKKMQSLVQRLQSTHLVFAKWNRRLEPFERILAKASASIARSAPVDLIRFPADSDRRFIGEDGSIRISAEDVQRVRC